jgi:hypothetical protein
MTRAERRRAERDQRKLGKSLTVAVTRIEFSSLLAPIAQGVEMQDRMWAFLLERGLRIEQGRAVFDETEFQAWLADRSKENEKPSATEAAA